MAEDSNNPSLNSGITPTRLGRYQTSWRSTLHVFLPNGEFRSVKFGDNSELKVGQYFVRNMFRKYLTNASGTIKITQPAFTCSKSTIETPEQCVKSVQSEQ